MPVPATILDTEEFKTTHSSSPEQRKTRQRGEHSRKVVTKCLSVSGSSSYRNWLPLLWWSNEEMNHGKSFGALYSLSWRCHVISHAKFSWSHRFTLGQRAWLLGVGVCQKSPGRLAITAPQGQAEDESQKRKNHCFSFTDPSIQVFIVD